MRPAVVFHKLPNWDTAKLTVRPELAEWLRRGRRRARLFWDAANWAPGAASCSVSKPVLYVCTRHVTDCMIWQAREYSTKRREICHCSNSWLKQGRAYPGGVIQQCKEAMKEWPFQPLRGRAVPSSLRWWPTGG